MLLLAKTGTMGRVAVSPWLPRGSDEMPPPSERTLFDALEPDASKHPEAARPAAKEGMPFSVALLALGSIRGLGTKSLKKIAQTVNGDLGQFLTNPPERLSEVLEGCKVSGAKKIAETIAGNASALIEAGEAACRDMESKGVRIIPPAELPDRLREGLPDPPLWLFVQGNADLLKHRPAVAVVGTRTPSSQGLRAAGFVSQILAPYPVLLVSGLAEGIDDEAHRTSLNEGIRNLAFLGHGINIVFPQETASTRERILKAGGAVATEYMPNEHYQKRYFVERNRLQAGLADLVIPVEAKPAGGTAHTVRFARQLGRAVAGIRWEGSNGIIEELAKEGRPIIDILTPAGWKQLDGIIRDLVEQAGQDSYPLLRLEQRLLKEIRARAIRKEDVQRLVARLNAAFSGADDETRNKSGDSGPHDVVRS